MEFSALMASLADHYDTAVMEFDYKELQLFLSGQASRLRVLTDTAQAGAYVLATKALIDGIFNARRKGPGRRKLGNIVDLDQ